MNTSTEHVEGYIAGNLAAQVSLRQQERYNALHDLLMMIDELDDEIGVTLPTRILRKRVQRKLKTREHHVELPAQSHDQHDHAEGDQGDILHQLRRSDRSH